MWGPRNVSEYQKRTLQKTPFKVETKQRFLWPNLLLIIFLLCSRYESLIFINVTKGSIKNRRRRKRGEKEGTAMLATNDDRPNGWIHSNLPLERGKQRFAIGMSHMFDENIVTFQLLLIGLPDWRLL